jgi:hypothetical protein
MFHPKCCAAVIVEASQMVRGKALPRSEVFTYTKAIDKPITEPAAIDEPKIDEPKPIVAAPKLVLIRRPIRNVGG